MFFSLSSKQEGTSLLQADSQSQPQSPDVSSNQASGWSKAANQVGPYAPQQGADQPGVGTAAAACWGRHREQTAETASGSSHSRTAALPGRPE